MKKLEQGRSNPIMICLCTCFRLYLLPVLSLCVIIVLHHRGKEICLYWKTTGRKLYKPVYLDTFIESFQLAVTSTLVLSVGSVILSGTLWHGFQKKRKKAMLFLMLPFWVNSLDHLTGWIIILQKRGILNYILEKLG